ncbi:A24 family peptidase, partial [Nocardioides sp.]|uniref:prepilin peptidase n=1 Tax=Nocardioides sp. TaxID=35761 RepID=UPI0027336650
RAAALAALVCGLVALGVPRLIAALPEPEEPRPAGPEEPPPSEAPSVVPGHTEETPASVAGGHKEPYADVAALPGLAWKSAVAAAAAGALVGLATGWDWALVVLLPLVPVGVALAVVDWRTRYLPTRLIAPSYAVVVVLVLAGWAVTGDAGDVVRAGWGWLVAGGLYVALWLVHPRGLGYGDVRLSGVLGLALGYAGWGPLLVGVYAGFLLGGVVGGLLSLLRVVERKGVPFGPFMLVGALLGVLWGEALVGSLVTGRG